MQATKITWDDKVGLKPRKIRINQCQDRDLNEIKTAVNNNADLLNQFTFSDPLGSIGIGGTPTAKLSVIGTSPGQDLLDVTDDAGNEKMKVSDVSTIIKGNGNTKETASLIVDNILGYVSPFNQFIQVWKSAGVNILELNSGGSLRLFGSNSNFSSSKYTILSDGALNFPNISRGGANSSGITFKANDLLFSHLGTQEFRLVAGGVIIGNSTSKETTAKLQVDSNTQGSIHSPRMTEAQRLAITSPAIGLHVYQTDGLEDVKVNKSNGWESYVTVSEYTVANLPTGVANKLAIVTDASAITYRGTATGGGSDRALVFFDGTNWIYH